jgi:hypothetical protein
MQKYIFFSFFCYLCFVKLSGVFQFEIHPNYPIIFPKKIQKIIVMSKWQIIIHKIEEMMHVQQVEDWAKNDYALLKALNTNISQKLKQLVCEDYQLGQHLNDKHWRSYKNMPKAEIDAFIQNDIEHKGAGSKYLFDLRIMIDYFIKGKQPAQSRTKNAFCLYAFGVIYDRQGVDTTLLNPPQTQDQTKLKQYHHTNWWLYFFDEKTKRLGRSFLHIQNSHELTLSNLMGNSLTEYKGRLRLDKHLQHLHFDLTPTSISEQHLHILVSIGMGACYPLALGVYTHILKDGAMTAGIIILEQILELEIEVQEMKPILIPVDKSTEYAIPSAILAYLTTGAGKTVKVPHAVHSIEDLETLI